MQHVFCYVRPWNVDQFRFLATKIMPSANIVSCSEHRKYDQSGMRRRYYECLKTGEVFEAPWLDSSLVNDLIARCRLLRSLEKTEAERHLRAMALAITASFETHKPVMVLSLTVDSYVMDLLRVIAGNKNIKFVALIGTFVNGFYRLSSRGEPTKNPSANYSSIAELKDSLLKDDYAPDFNKKSLVSPRRSVRKRWVANICRVPYFFLKRLVSGDYYNYHYWASQLVSSSQLHFFPPKDPGDLNWDKKLQGSQKPKLYIPLQMFPECTVDYWCQDLEVIDYYAVLNKLIDSLSSVFELVIKEHPSVMGSRPSGFYTKLRLDSRITVIPTYTPSNFVLRMVDGVVVWTGSVGFEAMLRGKPVFGLATPFYVAGSRFMKIQTLPDVDKMLLHIDKCSKSPVAAEEQDAILYNLISQLYKGYFINDGTWSVLNSSHKSQAEVVATSYLASLDSAEERSFP
ncbi:hypothetical protein HP436_07045 [Pseudomonas sp. CrR14]|nr:hypothetical protein [Pseudomonas sp. CrR14]